MAIGDFFIFYKKKLAAIYSQAEAETIASWAFQSVLQKTKSKIHLNKNEIIEPEKKQILHSYLVELLQHKPIQYVLGEAWFYGLKIFVDHSVLIPRPETEELVEWALNEIPKIKFQSPTNDSQQKNIKILDIGTGSGCIPIAIKKHIPNAEIFAIDISKEALKIAEKNAFENGVKISFFQLDILDESQWQSLPIFNYIISNPPYIPWQEKDKLDKTVANWEPSLALFSPNEDAILFYRKITEFAQKHLQKNGLIFFEIHQNYSKQTIEMMQENGFKTELKKDINGNDRMVKSFGS